ncbi:DEAD/DEAH box helicase [Alteribacillus sp. HJP-4]|uniref:DEAD/DEAH box helicase n=1 Tax=Alteribacillus sp. HJP-4 TaxID=2775394 RepID=UPI0035CCFBAF
MIKYVNVPAGVQMAPRKKEGSIMEMNGFKRFELHDFLLNALQQQDIHKPTDIQERLIPAIINGKDVIGQSRTGSGKTLAFLLPVLQKINPEIPRVQAVITAPTRELAGQLYDVLKQLITADPSSGITAKKITGGTDRTRTIEKLQQQPHIVVATPGRLKDMTSAQALDVHQCGMMVIDEADQMLDMGFLEDLDPVAALMPDNLQMMVFSATIPAKLQPFLKKYLRNPRHVEVKASEENPARIKHVFISLKHRDRTEVTVEFAKSIQPYLALIFTNTKEEADEVLDALLKEGLNADALHGGLTPRQRKQVMKKIMQLNVQYIVATDLAARGMDIKGISHVINHAVPRELEYYIHRTGRTARAGESGEAYTLYENEDTEALIKLQKQGVVPIFADWKKGALIPAEGPSLKSNRKSSSSADRTIRKPKPKKVKPGYKKKAQAEAMNRQKRASRINKSK